MTRKSIRPQSRRHLFLYDEDWAYLSSRFGSGAPSDRRLGVGPACREIIHAKVQALRSREVARLQAVHQVTHSSSERLDSSLSDSPEFIEEPADA